MAVQHTGGLAEHIVEVALLGPVRRAGETETGQPHGQPVAGHDGNSLGVIADEHLQALPDLHGRVPVVGQGNYGAGALPLVLYTHARWMPQDPSPQLVVSQPSTESSKSSRSCIDLVLPRKSVPR